MGASKNKQEVYIHDWEVQLSGYRTQVRPRPFSEGTKYFMFLLRRARERRRGGETEKECSTGVGFKAGREAAGIQCLPIHSRKIKQKERRSVINNT
jgi:hypothetical protein